MKVSISKIKLFKACRKAFYFKYVEDLIPNETAEPLQTGIDYHARIEALYKGEEVEEDFSKASAMAKAYEKHILPKLKKVTKPEKWYEKSFGRNNVLIGRVDGVSDDYIVEHKTVGTDLEEYEYGLQWDEQLLAYMWMTGLRHAKYTLCRKPTIRQKKDETDEQFYQRMIEWYDSDTDNKIRIVDIYRTDEEIAQFEYDLRAITNEMDFTNRYYRNTNHCFRWGRRCEYASICLNYDPDQTYVEFTKGVTNESTKD